MDKQNDSEKLFDKAFYEKLNKLKMLIKINPTSGLSGNRKSGAKGSSLEFSDFREYILGDDLRRIDWNAYGRTDRLLIKLFVEEKEGLFKIFTDCSMSMDFGAEHKGRFACRLGAALAYVVLNQLDRVSIHNHGSKGNIRSKAMTGKQAFPKFLDQLEHTDYSKDYDLWNVIQNESFQTRGVTVLVSDFYLKEDIETLLRYLAYKKQKVIVFHVLSEEEIEPEMEGTLNLIDSEDDGQAKVTMSTDILRSYHKTLESFVGHCREISRKYGAAYVLAPSSKPMDEVLVQLLNCRELLL